MKPFIKATTVAVLLLTSLTTLRAADYVETKSVCPMGREYYLYTPRQIDPDRVYWLVAGIHGAGIDGKRAGEFAPLADTGRCIVVGPSFPPGHKVLANQSEEQLIGLFEALARQYRLHSKMFVAGFSAGGQFTQRFTFKHPDLVVGCVAHSSGTWMTGGDYGGVKFDPALAGRVPFAISCGEADTATTYRDEFVPQNLALKPRIEWAREFAELLGRHQFYFKAEFYPGVAHKGSKGSSALTRESFALSTTGLHEPERSMVDAWFAAAERLIASGHADEARARMETIKDCRQLLSEPHDDAGWHTNTAMKDELRRRAEDYVKERLAELEAKLQRAAK